MEENTKENITQTFLKPYQPISLPNLMPSSLPTLLSRATNSQCSLKGSEDNGSIYYQVYTFLDALAKSP